MALSVSQRLHLYISLIFSDEKKTTQRNRDRRNKKSKFEHCAKTWNYGYRGHRRRIVNETSVPLRVAYSYHYTFNARLHLALINILILGYVNFLVSRLKELLGGEEYAEEGMMGDNKSPFFSYYLRREFTFPATSGLFARPGDISVY